MLPAAVVLAAALLALHNHARAQHHLPPLRPDPVLAHAAAVKAAAMRRCGFAHDACGKPWLHGLPDRAWIGENIADGYRTVAAVFKAWLASPGHRANILRRQFRRVGFARDGVFWAAEFSS